MNNMEPSAARAADNDLLSYADARALAARGGVLSTLFAWVDSYPMNAHSDLGRTGVVCPYTRQARKLDTIRLSVCPAGAEDEEDAFVAVRRGFVELPRIPAKRGMEQFRTVVLGFPNCDNQAGIDMLQRVMRRHRYYAMLRFRMMGFMHPSSEATGLWNPDFRPLRAPMPVLAIRYLVEQDAPFITYQHLQWGPYLLRYGIAGARRLMASRRRPATVRAAAG
jgi:hypothetical protein